MASFFRMLWPFLGLVITKTGRIYKYANHPERAPLKVKYDYCQYVARSFIKPFRIKLVVEGEENIPPERVLFCPNHQSDLDCVVLMMVNPKPSGFLAKLDVSKMPIVDGVMRAVDGDYLNRGFPLSELRKVNSIIDKLNSKPEMSYVIFPEGRRTPDVVHRTVQEFLSGAFRIALKTKITIVPVAHYGTFKLLDFKAEDQKVFPIQVTFLKPLRYEDYKDMKPQEIADIVEKMVAEEVDRQRARQEELDAYWNQKDHAKEFRQETKEYAKKLKREWKEEEKKNKLVVSEWQKTHPREPKNKRPKITKEQKAMIQKLKDERNALVRHYLRLGEEEKKMLQDKERKG